MRNHKPSPARPALLAAAAALALAASAVSAPPAPPSPPGAGGQAPKDKSLLDLYRTGGWLMHPILACSIGTVAISAFCFLKVDPRKMLPKNLAAAARRHIERRDAFSAYQLCEANPGPFPNTLAAALLKVKFDRPQCNKPAMEQAAAETLQHEETRCMLWVNYLNVFATIAPMLGLLGTVTGMIASFDQLAAGRSEPQDLAGGIGEAMITTAGGLIVGIPAMFLFFLFRNRLAATVAEIQKTVSFLIDILTGELEPGGEPAPAAEPVRVEAPPAHAAP